MGEGVLSENTGVATKGTVVGDAMGATAGDVPAGVPEQVSKFWTNANRGSRRRAAAMRRRMEGTRGREAEEEKEGV